MTEKEYHNLRGKVHLWSPNLHLHQ